MTDINQHIYYYHFSSLLFAAKVLPAVQVITLRTACVISEHHKALSCYGTLLSCSISMLVYQIPP